MDSSFSGPESKKAPNSVSFTSKVNKVTVLASLCEHLNQILLCANLKHHTIVFQVYEDKSMGILCYTDESGELICEGFDEGPRLTWQDMEKINREK